MPAQIDLRSEASICPLLRHVQLAICATGRFDTPYVPAAGPD